MNTITAIGEVLYDIYQGYKRPGGAPFNFIYHIIKLTGEGNFISRIGNDESGSALLDFMNYNGISTKFIQIDSEHQTGESVATLDDMKIPSWEIKTNTAYDYIELNNDIELLVNEKTDCLYFGTLAQRGMTTRNTYRHFFNKKIKYFCDLNIRQNYYTAEIIKECLTVCDILKLNAEEFHLVNELLLNEDFNSEKAPRRLMDLFEIEQLCITQGDKGAIIYTDNNTNHYNIKIENVVDTVGAGDAFASILCLGYLEEWPIEKTNMIASEFAGEITKTNSALPPDSTFYEKYRRLVNE